MSALPQTRTFIGLWLLLLVLLAATAVSSLIPLGAWNSTINLAIAVAKAALIAGFFMELRHDEPLLRLILAVAIGMLGVLILLSGSDFLTRTIAAAPWAAPPR